MMDNASALPTCPTAKTTAEDSRSKLVQNHPHDFTMSDKDYVLVLLFIKYVSDKYAGVPYAGLEAPSVGQCEWSASFKRDQCHAIPLPQSRDNLSSGPINVTSVGGQRSRYVGPHGGSGLRMSCCLGSQSKTPS
jgi:hypothetical protein